ncbi:UNVERIFIED_CONTAM: hypothetical protein FKN15_062582 [Acipenser sinensis]
MKTAYLLLSCALLLSGWSDAMADLSNEDPNSGQKRELEDLEQADVLDDGNAEDIDDLELSDGELLELESTLSHLKRELENYDQSLVEITAARDMVNNRSAESQAVAVAVGGSPPRSCAGCGGKIADRFLLYSMERYWHTRCLTCSCCQAQLGEIGTSCYSKGGMILCRNDYIRLFGHSGACSACGQSIPASEMVMRAQGNVYHLKCFTCATCRNRLVPGDRFHYVNGTIFCEHDRPSAALLNSHLPALQSSTMLPDQKAMAEQLAENYHNTWGRKKKLELQSKGDCEIRSCYHQFICHLATCHFGSR